MPSERSYSIKELAELAGVSPRTLRHYDEIGLLVPHRTDNGYRAYSDDDVHALQIILMLRACHIPLSSIAEALHDPDFEISTMLSAHLRDLRRQRSDLDQTIALVERMVIGMEEFNAMDDRERFEQLKRDSVASFEEEFGDEARERYGDEAIDAANERMLSMSKMAWDAKEELEQRIKDELKRAMATEDPRSDLSRLVAGMHAQWIRVHWGDASYTPEAHVALAEGYLQDPRFIAYYDDACGEGATAFLCEIIKANIS